MAAGKLAFFTIVGAALVSGLWLLGGALRDKGDGEYLEYLHLYRPANRSGSPTLPSVNVTQDLAVENAGTRGERELISFKLTPPKAHVGCPERGPLPPIAENGEKMCPIPGLNNLLYTQVNRYFCAVRDRVPVLNLRDRVCMKYSADWFRYSEILTFRDKTGTSVCFEDSTPDPKLNHCEWRFVHEWYGTQLFWKARSNIDFNAGYHTYAEAWLSAFMPGGVGSKYLALHIRRGDYYTHCKKMKKKAEPPWMSFSWNKSHQAVFQDPYGSSCYPSLEQIAHGVNKVLSLRPDLTAVFLSSNDKLLAYNLTSSGAISVPVVQLHFNKTVKPGGINHGGGLRGVDLAIVDMVLLSRASAWILNRFSSFSATPYELAYVNNRITHNSLWWW